MTNTKSVKKLLFCQNRMRFITAVIFSMATAVMEIVLAFAFMYLNNYAQSRDMSKVFRVTQAVIIGAVAYVICVFIGVKSKSGYAKTAVINLRKALLSSIMTNPMNQMGKTQGAYISVLTNDLIKVEQDYIIGLVDIIKYVFLFLSSLCAMFYLEWRLTLVVLLANSLLLVVSLLFGKKLKDTQEKNHDDEPVLDLYNQGYALRSFCCQGVSRRGKGA